MGLYSRLMSGLRKLVDSGVSFFSYSDGNGESRTIDLDDDAYGVLYSNAFRGCLLAKARPLSTLPVRVCERLDGVRVPATDPFSEAYAGLLRRKWNPFLTASDGIRWLVMTKDTVGEAFARVQFGKDGLPVAIWPMSGIPAIEVTADARPVFRYGGDRFTPAGTYLEHEIVWVKSPILDRDGVHGRSLAALAADEIGLSIDLPSFYGRMLNGEGNFPGWLESDQSLSPADVDKLSSQLSDGGGVVNAGKIRVFDKGLKYKNTSQSMVDLNLVEQEKWVLQEVCRTLSVPPQEVYELSHATYSNIEQGALNFANKTLVPECVAIETALSSVLWCAGLTSVNVSLDMNGLLRGSYKERMEGYRIGYFSSMYCANELRAYEDLPPYKGGEVYMRSMAYGAVDPETGEVSVPAGYSGSLPEPGGSGESERDDGRDPHAMGTALAVVHRDMAGRVRDRFEDRGDSEAFREFAGRVLAPMAEACRADGIEYSIDDDIEEIIHG